VPAPVEGITLWQVDGYPDGPRLSISGPESRPFALEVTDDLQKWTEVSRGVFGATDTKVPMDRPFPDLGLFRARELESPPWGPAAEP